MACWVARSQSAAAAKPRSANPALRSCPSYTKTVSLPLAGLVAAETPPMSQRSQVATGGSCISRVGVGLEGQRAAGEVAGDRARGGGA